MVLQIYQCSVPLKGRNSVSRYEQLVHIGRYAVTQRAFLENVLQLLCFIFLACNYVQTDWIRDIRIEIGNQT